MCRNTDHYEVGKDEMRDEGAKNDERAKPGETVSQSRDSDEKSGARAMTASQCGDGGGKPAEKEQNSQRRRG